MADGQRLDLYADDEGVEFIRGHVTAEVASASIRDWDPHEGPVVAIKHTWGRMVPGPRGSDYRTMLVHNVPAGARGAFRLTLAYTDPRTARCDGVALLPAGTPEGDR